MTMPKTGFGAWKIVKDWIIKKISRWCYCGSGGIMTAQLTDSENTMKKKAG